MSWITLDVIANSSTWTPVSAPFDCDIFAIRNTGAAPLRFSPDNGATEDVLEPGGQYSVAVHRFANWWLAGAPRYPAAQPVVYLKMESGVATVKVTFLR